MKQGLQGLVGAFSLLLLAACCLASAQGEAPAEESAEKSDDGTVELDIELPRPRFVGTPTNIDSDNLEEPSDEERKPLRAPEGTVNVALEKPVAASDDEPIIGELELVTDGDKEAVEGSFVEFGPGPQWVQIDLEAPHAIHWLLVWHYHSQARVYRDLVIQLSDDPEFIEGVQTVFNNDHDNSSGLGKGKDKEYIETYEGRAFPAQGIEARYVRLYSNGNTSNDMNHYIEVEVYGKPLE